MPKEMDPPKVDLSSKPPTTLPISPLGVWRLDGCEHFLDAVKAALAYSGDGIDDLYERIGRLVCEGAVQGNVNKARGRTNINIKAVPPGDGAKLDCMTTKQEEYDEVKLVITKLQEKASNIAMLVSSRMEAWLESCQRGLRQKLTSRGDPPH